MEDDIVRLLREQEKILGEMKTNVHHWMDELLRSAFDPESFLHLVDSMGIDLSRITGMERQGDGGDPYRVLGLENTATDEEVKRRYRELLKILHPDTAKAKGTGHMLKELISAYQKIAEERNW